MRINKNNINKISLTISNGHATTTSVQIAEVFSKRHDNVIQSIDKLECSEEFTNLNFKVSKYKDTTGKFNKSYEITKDGFVFLTMSFGGKKAAQFKEAYINAFNKMEQALLNKQLEDLKPKEIEDTREPKDYFPEHLLSEVFALNEILDGARNMLLITTDNKAGFKQNTRIINLKSVKSTLKMAIRQINLIIQDDIDRNNHRLLNLQL